MIDVNVSKDKYIGRWVGQENLFMLDETESKNRA